MAAEEPMIGKPLTRVEDRRFLTGEACFTDDLRPPGCAVLRVLRADVAHAKLQRLDTAAASAMPGVLAVCTAADLRAAGVGVMPSLSRAQPFAFLDRFGEPLPDASQYPLAEERIRYVGEPLAFVVAETDAAARDAVEAIAVDLESLTPVTHYQQALQRDAYAPLWDSMNSNVSFEWDLGDEDEVRASLQSAAHTAGASVRNNRVVIAFMEPRAAVAEFDGERLTLSAGNQGAPGLRDALAGIMDLEPQALRVITPDTGGGFGARGGVYPEFIHVLVAARLLRRPVVWTSERTEAFLSDYQSRDHCLRATLAVEAEGRVTALQAQADWRHGAYVPSRCFTVMTQYLPPTLGGVYQIGEAHLRLRGLFSNTTPQSAYRGIGRVEATCLVESAMDAAARAAGVDRIEFRRRNLVRPEQMPWTAAGGAVYHSGEFEANLDHAARLADWSGFEARRRQSEARARLRGIGIAMFIENDGGNPVEYASVVADEHGDIELLAGTQDFGMGHQTVFAQVLADELGVPMRRISVIEGDTDRIAQGSGSHGSRSARIGGAAVVEAAAAWVARGRELAGLMLQAGEDEIDYDRERAVFRVRDAAREAGIAELAGFAAARGEVLRADAQFTVSRQAHSNGAQICELEIDPETGTVRLCNHVLVLDAGAVLNPLIVDGQMHGGIAQGLGQAWLEHVVYDADSGQPLAGSFMDYALPRADDLLDFVTATNAVAESDNPLGVKGAGEGPTTGAPAAFLSALNDAVLRADGVEVQMPATPERVWRALRGQTAEAG